MYSYTSLALKIYIRVNKIKRTKKILSKDLNFF